MTQYGTLRLWAAFLTFFGVLSVLAAVAGTIIWAIEVEGELGDARRGAHRGPCRDLPRDDADRTGAGAPSDRGRGRHRRRASQPRPFVPDFLRKSLDRTGRGGRVPRRERKNLVELGDLTVGRMVNEPGWRWSYFTCGPTVGGEWCQARHLGVILSGRLAVEFPDGTSVTFEPGDVFDIPPGHDGYLQSVTSPCVQVEWAGLQSLCRFSDRDPQPRARDAPVHGSRRLHGDCGTARRHSLAGAALRALRVGPLRARAVPRTRGGDDR